MKSEKEKMLSGELYDAWDPELAADRRKARLLVKQLNDTNDQEDDLRKSILKKLIGHAGKGLWIEPPFFCDYGSNIILGSKVFFNFNCVILDVAVVTIGNNSLFGPNVQIYTATHPLEHSLREKGLELGKSISIGNNVWVGGGAIICPGVAIGDRSVIGAGSVVTKDVPSDVVAAGNPCKIIRKLNNDQEQNNPKASK